MANGTKPAYRVYTVEDREDADDAFWTQIGVAFAHNDTKGMNIILRALPLDGRLVLRRYTENTPTQDKSSQLRSDGITPPASPKAGAHFFGEFPKPRAK